jgi:ribosome-associated toxin RatA of RatAB toxin-antitoxin module
MNKKIALQTDQVLLGTVQGNIEKLEGRKRRFSARVEIPYSLEQVWHVLTDYESLPQVFANLAQIHRLDHFNGKLRLEHILIQKFMGIDFKARMILDVEEEFPHEIRENLVEGDFKEFSTYWRLTPLSPFEKNSGVNLAYELVVLPKNMHPIALLEYVLSQDVPTNLLAICKRVETLFGSSDCQTSV